MSLVKKLGIGILTGSIIAGCQPHLEASQAITINAEARSKLKVKKDEREKNLMYSLMTNNPYHIITDNNRYNIEFGNNEIRVITDNEKLFNTYQLGDKVKLTYKEIYNKRDKTHHTQFISVEKLN